MEPTIYKPSIYNGAGIYKAGAGGGVSELPKGLITTYGTENGIDFDNFELVSTDGVLKTPQYNAITRNFELFIEIKVNTKKIDNALFCSQVHYGSIDLQYSSSFGVLFIGIPDQHNYGWYNWDEVNNKRVITLSDFGIVVNEGEFHKINVKYDVTARHLVCYMDFIKIADSILSVSPPFLSTAFNFFANYERNVGSIAPGRIKLDTLQLIIDDERLI